jgi:hypothetical protein
MEDAMCWETDYEFWAEQRKAEVQKKQEQRAGAIDQLLNEANKQAEKTITESPPVAEVVPAK